MQRCCTPNRLQYSVSELLCVPGNQSIHVTHFTAVFQWSESKPTMSPTRARILKWDYLPWPSWWDLELFSDSTKYRMLFCFIWQRKFKPKVSSTLAPDTLLWKQEAKENTVFGSSKAGLDPKKLIFKGEKKAPRRMGIHFREMQNLIRFCILFKILNIVSSNNKSTLREYKYLLSPRFWGVWERSQIHTPPIWQLKASLVAPLVKNRPAMQETPVWFLGREDLLEMGWATHSSILGLPLWLSC